MFTGIVAAVGRIEQIEPLGADLALHCGQTLDDLGVVDVTAVDQADVLGRGSADGSCHPRGTGSLCRQAAGRDRR